MSIEFRQRSVGEYLQMVKRRRWHIALPTIAVFLAVAWVVSDLPSVYESTTELTITNPTISEKVAPSLTDMNLSDRIINISQSVLSRTSLEPMIDRHDLYREERASDVPMEELIVRMRNAIKLELKRGNDERVAGFTLTFRGSEPEQARAVASDLASKFIAAQNIAATQGAETTKEFIDNQLAQAKTNLEGLENERIKIMTANVQALPESGQGLIAQLEGLRSREATISKDKETLINGKGRIQDSINSLNAQMRLIDDYGQKEAQEAVDQASRIEDTPAYGQLIQRRAELTSRLENLKKQYRDKHPEIIQAQTDIKSLNDELEALKANTDQRVRRASQSLARKAEMQKKGLELEKQRAESQIAQIERQLEAKDEEARQTNAEIALVESKINQIPNVKVALEGVNNQYESAKKNYDELLAKYNVAQGQVTKETNQQGETIRLVDPANLPQTPANATKKPFFLALGGGAGLALGLLLAGFFEVPRLFRIQGIDDAKHYIGLPVLATVPPLLTEGEIAKNKRNYWIQLGAGICAAVVAVPLLILVLEVTRIFEALN